MNIYKTYQPPAGEGLYLKIQNGETVKVRIISEPYIFNNTFTDKQTGEVSITTRYAWVVYNHEADRGQILQLPVTGYRAVANYAADDEWGDPTKYDIKITREGEKLETKWHIAPSPKSVPLTKEQLTKAQEIELPKEIEGAISLSEAMAEPEKVKSLEGIGKKQKATMEDLKNLATTEPVEEINLSDVPF